VAGDEAKLRLPSCIRRGREGEEKRDMERRLRKGGLVLERGRLRGAGSCAEIESGDGGVGCSKIAGLGDGEYMRGPGLASNIENARSTDVAGSAVVGRPEDARGERDERAAADSVVIGRETF
jgi:hypothetical protein